MRPQVAIYVLCYTMRPTDGAIEGLCLATAAAAAVVVAVTLDGPGV